MSTTYTVDSATSRATPTPKPMKRVTIPAIKARKGDPEAEPLVMLTAYTVRTAQLLDPHCDILLVGDSLGQVIYGLPSTLPVSLDMMCAHGAAVSRGSYHAAVVVDMPFGSYEASPVHAFESASRILADTGAAAVKLEGGAAMADTVRFLSERGIPVMGHVGLTPQAVNTLGGYGARGRSGAEYDKIVGDAEAVAQAGAFAVVVEGVVETLADTIVGTLDVPVIGIGASARCDGQVLVTEDMLGLFERTPRFVKRYGNMAETMTEAVERYAADVRSRAFPSADEIYKPKS
ncbi:3-methyl-2-oxobutanoate hydroxymethyltransferase [Novosphingopyxis baekryungensis]|uniref:3-methyl-2-oxobutanoate hydroxymethyltransferase n=1 Tax=Novosphingopyxis baekryungensis TaxID=279369 RepID=UPI0003B6376F|nr:3-methyl-2-oxobutanoate hydroxymethyltransferase [Novosphingopyxis baekryungensis]